MASSRWTVTGVVTTLFVLLGACSVAEPSERSSSKAPRASDPAASAPPSPAPPAASPSPVEPAEPAPAQPAPRLASMSIPALGIGDLQVVAYEGTPDDLPGTRIQDRGVLAAPRGPGGGVGPGEVGNYIITGHRTSHGAPFAELPSLARGAHVFVTSGDRVYDYKITRTMKISFRSERSLARQSAPVPGYPGRQATRASITLSTCATPEDHAAGNYWSDELGNPEHRIDKVGVLVGVRKA